MLSIQYSLRLSSSASNPIKASFSSKPNKVPTLGIRIAPELEKIGFKRNIVYQLSVAVTPPWLLRHPVTDFTLHSLDKAVAVPEVFKVRFYELCDCVKTFYHIYTNGSKMGHRVLAAFYHRRGTSSIRLPGAAIIFNVELHDILLALDVVRRSKKRKTHYLAVRHIFQSYCSGRVTLTTI